MNAATPNKTKKEAPLTPILLNIIYVSMLMLCYIALVVRLNMNETYNKLKIHYIHNHCEFII